MEALKTVLSAGEAVRAALAGDPAVSGKTSKIFPVFTESAELPYILYRRTSTDTTATKSARPFADTAEIEVLCFTERYAEGVELAEAVRAALEGRELAIGGLRLRRCVLADGEEAYQDDAFVQSLTFSVRI